MWDASELFAGLAPPPTPITAQTYAKHGYPYFHTYDEGLSGVYSDFGPLQSVNEIDQKAEDAGAIAARREVKNQSNKPVVLIDLASRTLPFRHISDLRAEVRCFTVRYL